MSWFLTSKLREKLVQLKEDWKMVPITRLENYTRLHENTKDGIVCRTARLPQIYRRTREHGMSLKLSLDQMCRSTDTGGRRGRRTQQVLVVKGSKDVCLKEGGRQNDEKETHWWAIKESELIKFSNWWNEKRGGRVEDLLNVWTVGLVTVMGKHWKGRFLGKGSERWVVCV